MSAGHDGSWLRMERGQRTLLDAALEDREAFAALVAHSQGMVYGVAFRFFRNRAIAEDMAQETYLELFRNLGSLESDQHVVNWLRRTVTRKCIDHSRRKKNGPHLDFDSIAEPRAEAPERDPMLADELGRRVAELPDRMRMVVTLRFQEDLRIAEIAETMDIPVNTVKTLLRRALLRLRPKVAHLETEVCFAPAGR